MLGSQKEAPGDLPGSWGEGHLKKIPLIERCEGIATNNGPESWGEGRLKKIPLIEHCEGIATNNGPRIPTAGSRQFLNSMYEEGAASSLSAL